MTTSVPAPSGAGRTPTAPPTRASRCELPLTARLLQRFDATLEAADAVGECPRAIHRPGRGPLQDLQLIGSGLACGHRAANLFQQRAERLANPVVHLAGEPLAFDRKLALPASLGHALVLEPAGDAEDVRDAARHQFEDGDPFR